VKTIAFLHLANDGPSQPTLDDLMVQDMTSETKNVDVQRQPKRT